jgi:hypothetical protein
MPSRRAAGSTGGAAGAAEGDGAVKLVLRAAPRNCTLPFAPGPLPAPCSVALMLARWRSPRLRSGPAGPDGGPTTGEGPVGVPAGNLSDLGPEGGGPVGDEGSRGPPLEALLVLIGGGANLGMREGCIGPLSAAGVDGCEGLWRSANCAGSLSGARATAGEDAIESLLAFIVDPGAVKFRPPRPAVAPGPRGPDGVSGDGALAGAFRRP